MSFVTSTDYHQLGIILGYDAEKMKAKFRSREGLSSLRVQQLRAVIKFFRRKLEGINLPIPNWLSAGKGKAQCIEIILQFVSARTTEIIPGYSTGLTAPSVQNYSIQQAAQIGAAQAYRSGQFPGYQTQQLRRNYRAGGYGRASTGRYSPADSSSGAQGLFNYGLQPEAKQVVSATPPDVSKVCQSSEFNDRRSPFNTILKRYTACPILPARRSRFSLELDPETVNRLHRKEGVCLHLRLFDTTKKCHQEWNKFAGVSCQINNVFKQFQQKPSAISRSKAKGYQIVKALDISLEASRKMQVVLFSQYNLTGIIAVELVTVHPIQEIAERVRRRCRDRKKCEICSASTDLLRCSRCKSAWYCGVEHQQRDWLKHQKICSPQPVQPKLKTLQSMQSIAGDEDEIVCGESRVSLRCPLTVCRIKTPVRGVNCLHPQCVDLEAFLSFSNRTSIWQCPVCMKPLKYEDLLEDDKMAEILEKTKEDVDQVRLFPDGTFVPITLEEIREEDRKSQMARASRKRKAPSNSATPIPLNKPSEWAPSVALAAPGSQLPASSPSEAVIVLD